VFQNAALVLWTADYRVVTYLVTPLRFLFFNISVNRIIVLGISIAIIFILDFFLKRTYPGKAAVGIEVPNPAVLPVRLGEIVKEDEFQRHHSKLMIGLGKDLSGTPVYGDLVKMPHLLIAGTTGSGKSTTMAAMIDKIKGIRNKKTLQSKTNSSFLKISWNHRNLLHHYLPKPKDIKIKIR
jgi:Cdc6-like AAA superfamily ATPase